MQIVTILCDGAGKSGKGGYGFRFRVIEKNVKLFFRKICHKKDEFVFVEQRAAEVLSLFGRDWLHHFPSG